MKLISTNLYSNRKETADAYREILGDKEVAVMQVKTYNYYIDVNLEHCYINIYSLNKI